MLGRKKTFIYFGQGMILAYNLIFIFNGNYDIKTPQVIHLWNPLGYGITIV